MGLISAATTIFDAGSMSAGFGGNMTFIKKLTASSSATLSFVDGSGGVVLDDTYKEYVFTFKNIHPASDDASFTFQGNVSGGSGYNETITSTAFRTYHSESGSTNLSYGSGSDQAQGTAFQILMPYMDNDNDSNGGGSLHLFNPSSTVFVKHFMSRNQFVLNSAYSWNMLIAGYFNTTAAIDEIQFKMSSGNIDAGDICLYGIA